MIVATTINDQGVIRGKVRLIDFIRTALSMRKPYLDQLFVAMYPIDGEPFYKDYKVLQTHPSNVTFQLR